jgi:hypothetical protein
MMGAKTDDRGTDTPVQRFYGPEQRRRILEFVLYCDVAQEVHFPKREPAFFSPNVELHPGKGQTAGALHKDIRGDYKYKGNTENNETQQKPLLTLIIGSFLKK